MENRDQRSAFKMKELAEFRLEVLEVFPWLLGELGRGRSEGLVEVRVKFLV
jgi:hypothetical protein